MQTYKREKRILKKPKHLLETKKGLRHETIIKKKLNGRNLASILTAIIQTEIENTDSKEVNSKIKMNLRKRIQYSNLFECISDTPKIGQTSCGTLANIEFKTPKRDLFYIKSNSDQGYILKAKENNQSDIPKANTPSFFDISKDTVSAFKVVNHKSMISSSIFNFHYYGITIMENICEKKFKQIHVIDKTYPSCEGEEIV